MEAPLGTALARRPVTSRRLCVLLLTAVAVGCGRPSSTAPTRTTSTAVTTPPPLPPQLRITHLESVVQQGSRISLGAEVVGSAGVADCADRAVWTSTDQEIAHVSPAHELFAALNGYATITAACDGLTASVPVRVELTATHLFYYSYDVGRGASPVEGNIATRLEFLDGANAGQILNVTPNQSPAVLEGPIVLPVRLRMTARYFSGELLLQKSGSNATFSVPMIFQPEANTETFVRANGPVTASHDVTYPFVPAAAGTLDISTYHHGGDTSPDGLILEVWCDGHLVERTVNEQLGPFAGTPLSRAISPGGCELRVHRDSGLDYRVVLTYPH
jgi:hypothetical protein